MENVDRKTLEHVARRAALFHDGEQAAKALNALLRLDPSAAHVLAAELFGTATAWLGDAFGASD